MTQFNVSTVDWVNFFNEMFFWIRWHDYTKWSFIELGFLRLHPCSERWLRHSFSNCLPTTHSILHASSSLSLGVSCARCCAGHIRPMVSGVHGDWLYQNVLTSALKQRFSANHENFYVCVSDISSLCTMSLSSGTIYLFGISGCKVPSTKGICSERTPHDSCTSSSYLVKIDDQSSKPVITLKLVSSKYLSPNMCDAQANLVNRRLLHRMYLLW